jgi:hypothetical protein
VLQAKRLAVAQVGVGRLRRRGEAASAVLPAAGLHARDRDAGIHPARHQHRHVQDPVLLGADQLLAVVQQHRPRERVVHQQLRHRRLLADLADHEPLIERCIKRQVVGRGSAAGEQRHHRDAAMGDGIAELEGKVERHEAP